MTIISFQVSTYQYYDWSSRSRGKSNLSLKGTGQLRCSIFFEEDESATLKKAQRIGDTILLYYHYSQYQHVIDMLRNEKPITVYFDDSEYNNSRISTSDEPIGDGEEK